MHLNRTYLKCLVVAILSGEDKNLRKAILIWIYNLILVRSMPKRQKITDAKEEELIHWWWVCEMVQAFWNRVDGPQKSKQNKKLKLKLSYD